MKPGGRTAGERVAARNLNIGLLEKIGQRGCNRPALRQRDRYRRCMDGDARELAARAGGRIVGRCVRLRIFLHIRIRCILCMGVMRVSAWAAVLRQTAHGIGADTHRKTPVKGGKQQRPRHIQDQHGQAKRPVRSGCCLYVVSAHENSKTVAGDCPPQPQVLSSGYGFSTPHSGQVLPIMRAGVTGSLGSALSNTLKYAM